MKRFFFLVPYLNQNTTSINRIQSFIFEAAKRENILPYLLYFDFSNLNKMSIGIDGEIVSVLPENTIILKPNLNILQKVSFWLLKKRYDRVFKFLTVLHQLIYLSDVFVVHDVRKQLSALKMTKKDTLIALGGPFGLFNTAYNAYKCFDIKLVIDYRDPWTYGYPPVDGSFIFHYIKKYIVSKRENRILEASSLIFTVSDSLKSFFPDKYKSKINVVPNASNYKNIAVNYNPKTFDIIYLGTIYDIQILDDSFFKVLGKWIIDKRNINLIFLGSNNNAKLKKVIASNKLEKYTIITKRVSKDIIGNYLENASLFLHLKYGDRKDIITSKQSDYLSFRKPILLPFTDTGDLENSINTNNAGYVCNSDKQILKVLDKLYEKFLNGNVETTVYNDITNSREYWAKRFIDDIL